MSKKLTRVIVASLAALGALASVAGAPGLTNRTDAPAAYASGQTLEQIYAVDRVNDIYLTIPSTSVDALNNPDTLESYTAARIRINTPDGQSSGLIDIGLRLKGSTSLEKLSGHPSFKIKFNWASLKGARFLGLKRMTLNAMTQDSSLIHEASAYRLYNLMGVPTPKTGYARVFINGVFKSLYVNIETPDDIFLSKRFTDVTKHLYEGVALKDFVTGSDGGDAISGGFLVHEGWGQVPNKADLTAAINVANQKPSATWWSAMAKTWDRKRLVMQFAVDNFIGNWDSYSGPIINNYFVRSNNAGQFTMMPWGPDQTFGENRQTAKVLDDYFFAVDSPAVGFPWVQDAFHKSTMPRGRLFVKCLAYAPCKAEYLADLKAVTKKVEATKFVGFMRGLASKLAEFNIVAGASSSNDEQMRTIDWVGKQIVRVKAALKRNGVKY